MERLSDLLHVYVYVYVNVDVDVNYYSLVLFLVLPEWQLFALYVSFSSDYLIDWLFFPFVKIALSVVGVVGQNIFVIDPPKVFD